AVVHDAETEHHNSLRGLKPVDHPGQGKGQGNKKNYIVTLHKDYNLDVKGRVEAIANGAGLPGAGGRLGFVYSSALQGFSMSLPEPAADNVIRALLQNTGVKSVDEDGEAELADYDWGTATSGAVANQNLQIDNIDNGGVDVAIAIIDTGVDSSHPSLNVETSVDCTIEGETCTEVQDGNDSATHGTHVAGIAAACDNGQSEVVGIAPCARIWAIKVCNPGCTWSSIIAGIDYVAANKVNIDVANLSLGGASSGYTPVATAVTGAMNAGVPLACAAGNSNIDVDGFIPSRYDACMAVSGIDINLNEYAGTNFGEKVDITAPAVSVKSTLPGGGYGLKTGTSMAAPHVAGALGLLASKNKPQDDLDVQAILDQHKR
ncbi:MAG: hypothetical protein SGILL_008019, partial [Bacillariaceae sp.]